MTSLADNIIKALPVSFRHSAHSVAFIAKDFSVFTGLYFGARQFYPAASLPLTIFSASFLGTKLVIKLGSQYTLNHVSKLKAHIDLPYWILMARIITCVASPIFFMFTPYKLALFSGTGAVLGLLSGIRNLKQERPQLPPTQPNNFKEV